MGFISCFHLFSYVRPVFTTIQSYLTNSNAWFVVATVGAVKGSIANIDDANPDKGTTPEVEGNRQQQSRSGEVTIVILNEVSKDIQQRPGLRLRTAEGKRPLPDIPPRLRHCPLTYGLPEKQMALQEGMKNTWKDERRTPFLTRLRSSYQACGARWHRKIWPLSS